MVFLFAALILFCCYLIGSVSFAYWCGKLNGLDIRQHGSGNLGATNAARVLGRQYFFIVFIGDVFKGLLPVIGLQWYSNNLIDWQEQTLLRDLIPALAALACVLGHNFTIYHGFKGGKAVATTLGVILALAPIPAAGGFGIWIIVWLLIGSMKRISRSDAVGPASIIGVSAAPVIHFCFTPDTLQMPQLASTILIVLLALIVLIRHRSNAVKFYKQLHGTWEQAPVKQ
jgi:glycerol-3-phosphate acyltransferase PlsY